MSDVMEILYIYWVGEPDQRNWPEHLRHDPVRGHGEYALACGFRLGMLLAAEWLFPEAQWE